VAPFSLENMKHPNKSYCKNLYPLSMDVVHWGKKGDSHLILSEPMDCLGKLERWMDPAH